MMVVGEKGVVSGGRGGVHLLTNETLPWVKQHSRLFFHLLNWRLNIQWQLAELRGRSETPMIMNKVIRGIYISICEKRLESLGTYLKCFIRPNFCNLKIDADFFPQIPIFPGEAKPSLYSFVRKRDECQNGP